MKTLTLAKKSLLGLTLGLGLAFVAGSASAQTCDPKDPKCVPPPKDGTPCSPGYWKNHTELWVGIYCTDSSDPTCGELITALTCKGSDITCGRTAAANFLNDAVGGCFE